MVGPRLTRTTPYRTLPVAEGNRDSVLGSRRGLHLAAYARSAGRAKRKKERLTPAQYVERRRAAGGVRVVVLLLGHKGNI